MIKFKGNMKGSIVVCMRNTHRHDEITVGKQYTLTSDSNLIYIINDINNERFYMPELFELLSVLRENKLKNLLDD